MAVLSLAFLDVTKAMAQCVCVCVLGGLLLKPLQVHTCSLCVLADKREREREIVGPFSFRL